MYAVIDKYMGVIYYICRVVYQLTMITVQKRG